LLGCKNLPEEKRHRKTFRSGKVLLFECLKKHLASEFNSSFIHFLCKFAFDLAAATVLRMFQMPGDPLIHTGIFGHLM
jgi:hypothetical protein